MFRIFKKWKEKQVEKREILKKQINDRLEVNKRAAEINISKNKNEMFSMPCPINKMENCFEKCVHFEGGRIILLPSLYGEFSWSVSYPKCKLWK